MQDLGQGNYILYEWGIRPTRIRPRRARKRSTQSLRLLESRRRERELFISRSCFYSRVKVYFHPGYSKLPPILRVASHDQTTMTIHALFRVARQFWPEALINSYTETVNSKVYTLLRVTICLNIDYDTTAQLNVYRWFLWYEWRYLLHPLFYQTELIIIEIMQKKIMLIDLLYVKSILYA